MATPLGYIDTVQDSSGPLPPSAVPFALAITQGAGKALLNRRNGNVSLNTQAFVWSKIGAGVVDLYLKCMMLRCMLSGNGAYIAIAKGAVGADDAAPLGWFSHPVCNAVYYFRWQDYGTMYLFADAQDMYGVSADAWSAPTVPAVGPDGTNWGHVWKPYQDAWTADGGAFLTAANRLRARGTTYQFVGHGYGGGLAHLFARYVAASFGVAPSLITRIGGGLMGRADYAAATKLPATVDLFSRADPYPYWPPKFMGQYKLGQFGDDGQWVGPNARYVELEGTKTVYSGFGGPVIGRPDDALIRFSLAPKVLVNVPPVGHHLATYASVLYKAMHGEQQAYSFIFDLHAIEGALTAGGF